MLNKIPLSVLRSFEAAGRCLSFKEAAGELGLTPGAISHAITKLEDALGASLFTRTTRAIALTPEGETLLARVSPAFESLRIGLEQVSTRATSLLRLHAAPSFAVQFLAPRLPGYIAENPGLEVRLATSTDYARFKTDEFDADIIYGRFAMPPGLIVVPLGAERVMPLCAPAIAARVLTPADLLSHQLIQSDNKQLRWPDWFAANDLPCPPPRGLRFDRSFLAIGAAVEGHGIALESTFLAHRELAEGKLIAPLRRGAENLTYEAHHFVYPRSRAGNALIADFLGWLRRERAAAG